MTENYIILSRINIRNLDHSNQTILLKPYYILPLKFIRFEHFSNFLKTIELF